MINFDTIIIGAGPAGMTAAIYASRREMKVLIIAKDIGGQMLWASDIENYPGFKNIQSFELISKIQEQVKALGVDIKLEEVISIKKTEEGFELSSEKGIYTASTIIYTAGLLPKRLSVPGEEKFSGKGVSYCANCDGPLYRNKTIAVVGGGNSALDAAEVMSKIAKRVFLIHRRSAFRAFEGLIDKIKSCQNIEIIFDHEIKDIIGDKFVESIDIVDNQSGAIKTLEVEGVFVEIGHIANTALVNNLTERDQWNQIIIDEKCRTCTPGIFAAGDVTTVPFKQITIAVGQATIAALSAYEFLQQKNGIKSNGIFDRSKQR